jgi:hypothetical protein
MVADGPSSGLNYLPIRQVVYSPAIISSTCEFAELSSVEPHFGHTLVPVPAGGANADPPRPSCDNLRLKIRTPSCKRFIS